MKQQQQYTEESTHINQVLPLMLDEGRSKGPTRKMVLRPKSIGFQNMEKRHTERVICVFDSLLAITECEEKYPSVVED